MSIKPKTLNDFNKLVIETKEKYLKAKMDYNRNYTIKEETLGEDKIFWICNTWDADKIVYNNEMKFIVHKHIIMADIDILATMREAL